MKLTPHKLEGWGYRMVKISYPNFNRFQLIHACDRQTAVQMDGWAIRYDTIGEFNVDWKAEYSVSSTRSQKKKLKQPTPVPLCDSSFMAHNFRNTE